MPLTLNYSTSLLLLLLFFYTTSENDLCTFNNDCGDCDFCGESNRDYASCDFINLFCEQGTNTFTSAYRSLKNNYLYYFKREKDHEIFCGQQKDTVKKDKTETIIIKTGQSYTKGSRVHCHYNVVYDNFKKYNSLMTYEIAKSNTVINQLKFDLIVLYHTKTETEADLFSDDELRNRPYRIDVTGYDEVELFLDFKEINDYSHFDENFNVKVKLNLKEGQTEEEEEKESSSGIAALFGEIFGGIAALGIIAAIVCCCCNREEKTYVVKEKSACIIY